MSTVIHVQSELAAGVCVLAVAFALCLQLCEPRRWLTVSASEYFYAATFTFLPPGYIYPMTG